MQRNVETTSDPEGGKRKRAREHTVQMEDARIMVWEGGSDPYIKRKGDAVQLFFAVGAGDGPSHFIRTDADGSEELRDDDDFDEEMRRYVDETLEGVKGFEDHHWDGNAVTYRRYYSASVLKHKRVHHEVLQRSAVYRFRVEICKE